MQCRCSHTLDHACSLLRNSQCRLWWLYHHSALYLRLKHALLPCIGSRLKSSGRLLIDNAMPVGPNHGSSMQCAKEHSHISVCRECFQGFFGSLPSFCITEYHTLLMVLVLVLVDTEVSQPHEHTDLHHQERRFTYLKSYISIPLVHLRMVNKMYNSGVHGIPHLLASYTICTLSRSSSSWDKAQYLFYLWLLPFASMASNLNWERGKQGRFPLKPGGMVCMGGPHSPFSPFWYQFQCTMFDIYF